MKNILKKIPSFGLGHERSKSPIIDIATQNPKAGFNGPTVDNTGQTHRALNPQIRLKSPYSAPKRGKEEREREREREREECKRENRASPVEPRAEPLRLRRREAVLSAARAAVPPPPPPPRPIRPLLPLFLAPLSMSTAPLPVSPLKP